MRADGLLAMFDRWGRWALPGAVLLFFVLLTLAPGSAQRPQRSNMASRPSARMSGNPHVSGS